MATSFLGIFILFALFNYSFQQKEIKCRACKEGDTFEGSDLSTHFNSLKSCEDPLNDTQINCAQCATLTFSKGEAEAVVRSCAKDCDETLLAPLEEKEIIYKCEPCPTELCNDQPKSNETPDVSAKPNGKPNGNVPSGPSSEKPSSATSLAASTTIVALIFFQPFQLI